MPPTQYFGEVIGSDSQLLEVECHQLYHAPAFGSFIRADCDGSNRRHFAVVTHITTGPFDGARVVQAHGMPPGELEARKPHLTSLLRTTFQALPVGYGEESALLAGISPLPPRLHCYVAPASAEEIKQLTGQPGWLRPLTRSTELPLEELLVSAIRCAQSAWGTDAPLVTWGKYLARLLGRDFVTLETVLARLAPAGAVTPSVRRSAPMPSSTNGTARPRPTPPPPAKPERKHPSYEEPMRYYGNNFLPPAPPKQTPEGGYSTGYLDPFAEEL